MHTTSEEQRDAILNAVFTPLKREPPVVGSAIGSAEWIPIQLAPKDGTRVLLWCGDEVEVGYWSTSTWVRNVKPDGSLTDGAWIIYENRSDTIELAPTHWMALPIPPNTGAKARQPETPANQ